MTKIGDKIELQKQTVKVEPCKDCDRPMVNLDADELQAGDLTTLKRVGVRISNPQTSRAICVSCEYTPRPTVGQRISSFFESDDDGDDDSSLFSSGGFIGGSSFGGFSGGSFGGFGGGGFSGGGASGSF